MKKNLALAILTALVVVGVPSVHAAKYPLKTCLVTGDELGDDPVDVNYKGRTVPLCCKSCVRKFNANPAKYVAILDKELAKRKM